MHQRLKKCMKVFQKTKGRCAYCGISLDKLRFTLDHIIPRSKGGTDEIVNLVACCQGCSKRKWDKDHTKEARMDQRLKKRMKVFQKTKGRCAYCGISLDKSRFTLDHIIPRSKGGTDEIVNLVACCEGCNKRKWDKDLIEFLPIIGCLLESYRHYKENAGKGIPAL